MASATIGYLNKYNYIQIGFGYFIYWINLELSSLWNKKSYSI
jgi:hypothetical protein